MTFGVSHGGCVSGADVVVVIASAREPVLEGAWPAEGAQVYAAGGNYWMRREGDEDAVAKPRLTVVIDLDQSIRIYGRGPGGHCG